MGLRSTCGNTLAWMCFGSLNIHKSQLGGADNRFSHPFRSKTIKRSMRINAQVKAVGVFNLHQDFDPRLTIAGVVVSKAVRAKITTRTDQ